MDHDSRGQKATPETAAQAKVDLREALRACERASERAFKVVQACRLNKPAGLSVETL